MQTFLRFLSNEPEVKCDFVSLHRKGATFGPDRPEIQRLIAAAEETADMALAIDPARFKGIPIVNNEADMKVGFDMSVTKIRGSPVDQAAHSNARVSADTGARIDQPYSR
jgi:hypothetical protein